MNKKARIDTYSTQYDIDFVVADSKVTLNDLRELYCYDDDTELDDTWNDCSACTGTVKRKEDGATVLLVHYTKPSSFTSSGDDLLDLIDICAHEATHVAIDIYNIVAADIDTKNQETFAYFVAYIAERIAKTLLNK